MSEEKYYTLRVWETLGRRSILYDLTAANVEKAKESIWRNGFLARVDEKTKELVSPYMIKQVFIEEQEAKTGKSPETLQATDNKEKQQS